MAWNWVEGVSYPSDRASEKDLRGCSRDSKGWVETRFGYMLEAFKYGAPPHGGIAFGLDRLVMILAGVSSIREVIAFPKTQKGQCLMTESPSQVSEKQLRGLHIECLNVEKES